MTIFEIFGLGEIPFGERSNIEVGEMYKKGTYKFEKPDRCPEAIFPTLQRCCDPDPDNRPSFEELSQYFSANLPTWSVSHVVVSESGSLHDYAYST